jgi:hypothetical protein
MMFRDPAQRSAVFACLLEHRWLPAELFTASGPTARALAGAAPRGTALPSAEQRILGVALAIWNGAGTLPLPELLALEAPCQAALGSLLMAIGLGHSAVDRWIEERDDGAR